MKADEKTYGQIMSSLGTAVGCIERALDLIEYDRSRDDEDELRGKLMKAHEAIVTAAARLEQG
jgi:hypothetical protein